MTVKIRLEVKESNVNFLMTLRNDLPYIKAIPINKLKESLLLDEIVETVDDTNLIKA